MEHTEGFGVRLRPVGVEDAAFIVWLRNQEFVIGKLGDSATDVASQEAWLRNHFQRKNDYYFIVETLSGISLGTNGLYDIVGTVGETGRYLVRPDVPAAIPSSILAFDLAFGRLGLREVLARCVATNHTIHSLNRKFGFHQTEVVSGSQFIGGKPVDMVHFALKAEEWPKSRARLVPLAEYAETRIRAWEEQFRFDDLEVGTSPRVLATA